MHIQLHIKPGPMKSQLYQFTNVAAKNNWSFSSILGKRAARVHADVRITQQAPHLLGKIAIIVSATNLLVRLVLEPRRQLWTTLHARNVVAVLFTCITHRWDYQFCVHHTQVRLSVLCASHTGEIISSVCITHRGDYQFCVHHTRVRLSVLCASHTGEIISSVCIAHRWDYQFTCIIHRWDYQFCVLSHSKVPTCSVPVALLKQWRRIMAVNYINWQCSMILKWFITYEYITLNPSIMMMTTTTTIDTDRQALNVTINTVSTLCPLISQFHLPNKNCKINDTSHSQFCL